MGIRGLQYEAGWTTGGQAVGEAFQFRDLDAATQWYHNLIELTPHREAGIYQSRSTAQPLYTVVQGVGGPGRRGRTPNPSSLPESWSELRPPEWGEATAEERFLLGAMERLSWTTVRHYHPDYALYQQYASAQDLLNIPRQHGGASALQQAGQRIERIIDYRDPVSGERHQTVYGYDAALERGPYFVTVEIAGSDQRVSYVFSDPDAYADAVREGASAGQEILRSPHLRVVEGGL
jgi:hypothetical protein